MYRSEMLGVTCVSEWNDNSYRLVIPSLELDGGLPRKFINVERGKSKYTVSKRSAELSQNQIHRNELVGIFGRLILIR
jgi:hypothetical protein